MADYYISMETNTPPGNDANSGSFSAPWLTLNRALTEGRVARGDTIFLRAGVYSVVDTVLAVGTGDGVSPVTISPYNDEVSTIVPGVLSARMIHLDWSFVAGLVIDGGPNRCISILNTTSQNKPIFYIERSFLTIRRCNLDPNLVDFYANSTGFIRISHIVNNTVLTLERNKINNVLSNLVFVNNGSHVLNIVGNLIDNVGQASPVRPGILQANGSVSLTETNNTVVRSKGWMHYFTVAGNNFNINNNIYANNPDGSLTNVFNFNAISGNHLTSNLSSWNAKNNCAWRCLQDSDAVSISSSLDYDYLFVNNSSGASYVPIDTTNRFIRPLFAVYGTGPSDSILTLQESSHLSARGGYGNQPSGGDFNGVAWSGNDIGCYANPTSTPVGITLIDRVGFVGDSIMHGSAATDDQHAAFGVFYSETGVEYANKDDCSIIGLRIEGLPFISDRCIFETFPKTIFISIGVNSMGTFGSESPAILQTDRSVAASYIASVMQKISNHGISPIWLGTESIIGSPPNNSNIIDLNNKMSSLCTKNGWKNWSILRYMTALSDSWKSDFYFNLAADVHPNNAGHQAIGHMAAIMFMGVGPSPTTNDGPPRNNITRLTGTSATINPTDTYEFSDTNGWRVVTGWTTGTSNFAFDANGVPVSFTGQQLIDAGVGDKLFCGTEQIAGYSEPQTGATLAKIKEITGVA